ncbi:sensor domain-containing diguanylate cyclase [Azospirillum rugosum]|uniref:Diguanylate cyclase (GGDEF)-like protein n=1 Tax=Azospirillum rugosum TaxID=416170 RepID=A0ABS4SWX1_9PROT|nr:sensor domain-containing diguanylate cyclase [Azospirillum rugosum]MBP2297058.1 diguanylate cyclase (GGDEF)-like protein [Azospirillum rugosum]MDQ0530852.1 diguanylate cyclase (GGDEF)-like protein [Azospirillum rugosum]
MAVMRMGLRGTVAVTSGALVIVMAGLMAHTTGDQARRQLEEEIGRSLSEAAYQMADKLDADMAARAQQIGVLARIDALQNWGAAQKVVDELKAKDQTVAWVGVTDRSGKVVAASEGILLGADASSRPVYLEGRKGPFAGDVHDAVMLAKLLPNPSGEPMKFVDIAAPIQDAAGALVGVLGAHFSWAWACQAERSFRQAMHGRLDLETFVVAKDATILLGPEGSLGQALDLPSVRSARVDRSGWAAETWPDGKPYLTGYAFGSGHGDYPGLGWTVLVRQPLDIAYAPADSLQRGILMRGTLFAVCLSALSWFAAVWITGPLRSIATAAKRLRAGEVGVEMPEVGGVAEVEDLSRSLRDLIAALTDSRKALVQMEDAAHQDRLTALPNRRFLERYAEALARRPGKPPFAVMYLDLDGFKPVNDTMGHQAGDLVLRQVAARLASCVRGEDVVSRLGGDEFVAVVVPVPGKKPPNLKEIAERLIAAVNEPIVISGRTVRVGCSIGMAIWPNHGACLHDVLGHADQALYAAKHAGKNQMADYGELLQAGEAMIHA